MICNLNAVKKRIRLPHILLLTLLSLQSLAQNREADSLTNILKTLPEDSTRVNTLVALSRASLNSDLDEAIRYGNEAKNLANKIGYQSGAAFALKSIGQGYLLQANYPEAIAQFQKSLATFDSINNKAGIANILSNIGGVYFNSGDDTKAIDFYLRSLRVSEEIDDKLRIATALNNIGGVYQNKAATVQKSLEYFLRAYTIFKQIGYSDGIGIASMNIGEIYKNEHKYDSAIFYFDASLEVYRGTVDSTFPLTYIGVIYADIGDFESALLYQNKSLEIAKKLEAKLEMTQSLIGIAETQKKRGSHKLAISFYNDAKKIATEISARNELKLAYEGLGNSYASIGDFRNAYTYETLLSSIKDTLYNTANDKKVQQLQFNFDIEKKEAEIDLLTKDQALKAATIQRQKIINYASAITGFLLLFVIMGFYNRYKYVRKTNKIIKEERDRSKELLLNILPEETARELETSGYAKTRYYDSVTVLFTDFKGFSSIAGKLSPQALVAELNDYFGTFDEIVERFGLEKIKTIGDAYMCAGGIPLANNTHPQNAVNAALAMQEYMQKQNQDRQSRGEQWWELRIGIHTGPIVAGVVGKKKYAYDIWGDTVNIASRMESNGEAGKVNISSATYDHIKENYVCQHRGKISAKNIGEVDMYFVERNIKEPALQPASVIV